MIRNLKEEMLIESGITCYISMGVAAVIGGVVSVGSAIAGANASKQAARDAAGAAQKGYYNPDEAAFQDPFAQQRRDRIDEQFTSAQAGPAQDFRDRQLSQYDELGNRPSVAAAQLQQGLDQGQANLVSSAASMPQGGMSARNLLNAQQGLAGQAQNTAVTARLQEQQQNDALRANLSGQGRQGDVSSYDSQQKANLGLINQQAIEDERNRQALIEREKLKEMNRRGVSGNVAGVHQARGKADAAMFGGLAQAGGAITSAAIEKL